MGILDDAIKEHLELKRRHGAAEEEVLRQAEEALGPARREVAPQDAENGDGAEASEAGEAAVEQPELSEGLAPEAHADEALEPEPPEALEPHGDPLASEALGEEHAHAGPAPQEPYETPAAVDPEQPLGSDPPLPEPFDAAVPAGDTPARGFAAVEDDDPLEGDEDFFVEDEAPAAGAGEDDDEAEDPDVLEDTPEFLQETPEHDRLWFEQKPPRDFDFD